MLHDPGDGLIWSWPSAFGAVLGYLLHWLMSWSEWRKVSGHEKMRLRDFLNSDPPGVLIGLVSTIIVYFSLPLLGQLTWIKELIGFTPGINFFSAAITAYCSNSIAIKLRNISRKFDGSSQ